MHLFIGAADPDKSSTRRTETFSLSLFTSQARDVDEDG